MSSLLLFLKGYEGYEGRRREKEKEREKKRGPIHRALSLSLSLCVCVCLQVPFPSSNQERGSVKKPPLSTAQSPKDP